MHVLANNLFLGLPNSLYTPKKNALEHLKFVYRFYLRNTPTFITPQLTMNSQ